MRSLMIGLCILSNLTNSVFAAGQNSSGEGLSTLSNSPYALEFYGQKDAEQTLGKRSSSSFNYFTKRYETMNSNYNVANAAVTAEKLIHQGVAVASVAFYGAAAAAGAGGTAISGGTASPVTLALTAWALSEGIDKGARLLKDAVDNNRAQQLENSLKIYRQATQDEKLNTLANLAPEEAFKKIDNIAPIYERDPEGVSDADRIAINRTYIKILADSVKLNAIKEKVVLSKINTDVAALKLEQQELSIQNKAIYKTLVEFEKNSQEQLRQLQLNQETLFTQVNALTDGVNAHSADLLTAKKDIEFVQGLLFGKLSPSEQVAALKNESYLKDLTGEQRADALKKAELAQTCDNIRQYAGDFLMAGNAFLVLGEHFGVNKKVLDVVAKSIKFGGAAANAAVGIIAGNPFAAVSAIFGLFGKDIAQERHEQIMSALGEIMKTQQALLEGQRKIMENQGKIMAQIRQLAISVQRNHDEIMEKLDAMHSDIIYNRKLIVLGLQQDLLACDKFVAERSVISASDKKVAYEEYIRNAELDENFVPCLNGLRTYFSGKIGTPAGLQLFTSDTHLETPSKFTREVYNPLVTFVNLENSSPNEQKGGVTDAITDLLASTNSMAGPIAPNVSSGRLEHLQGFFSEYSNHGNRAGMPDYLDSAVINHYVSVLLEMHRYFVFRTLDQSHRFVGYNDLSLPNKVDLTGRRYLENALDIIDVSLAQQWLLVGGGLLPRMAEDFSFHGNYSRLEAQKSLDFSLGKARVEHVSDFTNSADQSLVEALRYNPILARNLMTFYLGKKLPSGTAGILNQREEGPKWMEETLRTLLNEPVVVKNDATGLQLEIASAIAPDGTVRPSFLIPLPTGDDVMAPSMMVTQDIEKLQNLRTRVVEALISYDFGKDDNWKTFLTTGKIPADQLH